MLFWSKTVYSKAMNYIKRHLADALKESFSYDKSITITGARQVGKSTLIQKTFNQIKRISLMDG